MDAISFVLGVRTNQLRGQQLRDLIFRTEGEGHVDGRDAHVKIVYAKTDPDVDENPELVTFTRKISVSNPLLLLLSCSSPPSLPCPRPLPPRCAALAELPRPADIHGRLRFLFRARAGCPTSRLALACQLSVTGGCAQAEGSSQYKLNNRNVTWEAYSKGLADIGINVKSRRFLVFQGDVENIAGMKPIELTKYFEKVSGSADLKGDYDEALAAKVRAAPGWCPMPNSHSNTQRAEPPGLGCGADGVRGELHLPLPEEEEHGGREAAGQGPAGARPAAAVGGGGRGRVSGGGGGGGDGW